MKMIECTTPESRLILRSLVPSDRSEKYLSWLNDGEVQHYSRRRGRIFTMADIDTFLTEAQNSSDYFLAVIVKDTGVHIGNLSLNNLDTKNSSAEISIMMGNRDYWGKGLATEAVELAIQVGFSQLGLHRLWAESPNPAFNAIMEKVGWVKEGVRREAFLLDGTYCDHICWSILAQEWKQ